MDDTSSTDESLLREAFGETSYSEYVSNDGDDDSSYPTDIENRLSNGKKSLSNPAKKPAPKRRKRKEQTEPNSSGETTPTDSDVSENSSKKGKLAEINGND